MEGCDPVNNIKNIKEEIDTILARAECEDNDIEIIAVSKMVGQERIRVLLEAGHRHFGENKLQEAVKKWPELLKQYPNINLHFIGPLQTKKVEDVVTFFQYIHSLDRPKLARVLADEIQKQARHPALFIQVNTGEEPQKSGVLPHELQKFITLCSKEYHLKISGLMCLPPKEDMPAPHFAFLEKCARDNGLECLSMGMSHDFRMAIPFGATHIRLGAAIFGAQSVKSVEL